MVVHTYDTRNLPAPEPMMTILEALKNLQRGECLLMVHRMAPALLFPILERAGWFYEITPLKEELFHIRIGFFDEMEAIKKATA